MCECEDAYKRDKILLEEKLAEGLEYDVQEFGEARYF